MKPTLPQLRRLVGNPDAYALQLEDGSWRPVREPLTPAVLANHLSGKHTVGTYIGHNVNGVTMARTLVFDLDTGDDASAQAHALGEALVDLGLPVVSFGTEFSGRKGYHVWVVLPEFRPNAELRRVGRAVLALSGLPSGTEVFPKQDEVKDLGNLVKLPGGIHRVTGNHNDFIGPVPSVVPLKVWNDLLGSLPEEQRARRNAPVDNRFPCLGAIQRGVSEGGRNIQLFHLAALFRRHGAEDALLETILRHVNELSSPPLDDDELLRIVEGSATSGPICQQLPQDMQDECGEYCIRQRIAGLQPRPGILRNAADGEAVVVTARHTGEGYIGLEHQDLAVVAKGGLRSREQKEND